MLERSDYMAIRKELDFSKRTGIAFCLVAINLSLLALAVFLLQQDNIILFVLSQLLIAIFMFQNFCLVHEAGHDNLSKNKIVNNTIGHISGILSGYPYFSWKFSHQQHHLWSGNIDRDPVLKNLKKMREKGKVNPIFSVCWRIYMPIAAMVQILVYWFYPLELMKEKTKAKRKMLLKCIFSTALILTSYLIMFYFFGDIFSFKNLWLAFVIYFLITEFVNLPHHVAMPMFNDEGKKRILNPWEQHVITRSCYYPKVVSEFLCMNFNFHTEHHYYPSLPWYELRKARKLIKEKLDNEYNELKGFSWNFQSRKKKAFSVFTNNPEHNYLKEKFED